MNTALGIRSAPTSTEPIEDMSDTDAAPSKDLHLVVFIHGLWGSPGHLSQLAKALRTAAEKTEDLHLLIAKNNSGSFTYDGIETGGERVTREVEDKLVDLDKKGNTVTKISVIGYSLGGLIARYAIGLLYSKGYFDRLKATNFCTFASPHLGVRTPLLGWQNHFFNEIASRTLSTSGDQLFLNDNFRGTGRSLLAIMADPGSVFVKALQHFKHRSLYANIVNDRSVPYYTAAISRIDPFVDIDAIDIGYAPGYDEVMLNPPDSSLPLDPIPSFDSDTEGKAKKPMAVPKASAPTYYESISNGARNFTGKLPLYFFMTTVAPIGALVYVANAGWQTVKSAQRVKDHEEGKTGTDFAPYRSPGLLEGMQKRAEKAFEQMHGAQGEEFLDDAKPEGDTPNGSTSHSGAQTPDDANGHALKPTQSPPAQTLSLSDTATQAAQAQNKTPFPTLALTPEQFEMIDSLDSVGFKKYPVHIHRANHSHAAIIVRMQRPGFGEGRVVSRHWTERFEY